MSRSIYSLESSLSRGQKQSKKKLKRMSDLCPSGRAHLVVEVAVADEEEGAAIGVARNMTH
jgi:hypothetical protein